MRARSLRTHHMGTSNRHESINHEQSQAKRHTVMERSFNKTASLRGSEFGESRMLALQSCMAGDKCNNPFLGDHNEFETQRFDKFNVRQYKQQKIPNIATKNTLKLANNLNKNIESIKQSFNGKKINMHKLKELKNSFVNNNKNKRNLQEYFQKYSENGSIGYTGLKKLVKEYGFDVNQDEAELIFALTNQANNSQNQNGKITIDGFVELMTKEDIFYQTLKFEQNNITFGQNFSPPVHQVLRNKFTSIKEAFNIYKFNNEQICRKEFDYVMKKLDLTDLVLPQEERNQIFHKYSQNGIFNVESLICAIAEQENISKIPKLKSEFIEEIEANKEKEYINSTNHREFSFNNLSYLEFENEFNKAKEIIECLKNIKNNNKFNLFNEINQNSNHILKKELIFKIENIFKKEGINFSKENYEAFAAYANSDINGYVNLEKLNHQIFIQEEKSAKENFERKIRKQSPKTENVNQSKEIDHNQAIHSLNKIKDQKLNPEARELFKYFDKDNDGHISEKEFKQRMKDINILENWEVENLLNHLKISEKGSINFQEFSKTIKEQNIQFEDLPIIQTRNSRNLTNWSEASKTKKSIIENSKFSTYENPNRFSAWPSHITTQDLSLISPNKAIGMHITESDRFNNNKQDFGKNEKSKSLAIADQKIKRIAEWNKTIQERNQINEEKVEKKQEANNYYLRLAKEKYEINCHQ